LQESRPEHKAEDRKLEIRELVNWGIRLSGYQKIRVQRHKASSERSPLDCGVIRTAGYQVKKQRTEDGGQKKEVGRQTTEDGTQRTEDGRQRTEDGRQKARDVWWMAARCSYVVLRMSYCG